MVAEQLGHQLGIRRFTAAAAGTGELQQRTVELGFLGQIVRETQILVGKVFEGCSVSSS